MFTLVVDTYAAVSTFIMYFDPLEQFEVVSTLSIGGAILFNNLALIMAANVALMAAFLGSHDFNLTNNYDYVTRSIYQLVRSMVKENLYIKKQQYFSVLFYLFVTLLLANLFGLLPFSFTLTSSFILTFFLSLLHFIGVNLIGGTRHR
jgi:F-type H+-transporting ATPase subunit a